MSAPLHCCYLIASPSWPDRRQRKHRRTNAQSPLRLLRRQRASTREPDPDVLLVRHRGEPHAVGHPALSPARAPLRGAAARRRADGGGARVPFAEWTDPGAFAELTARPVTRVSISLS